ncbi:hypothetical protein MTBUT4_250005 [Magnetospirillum sp. UT-4]|nr:hypothetical protein MTBUT4_250005 [Magnetospirillum sp. UT-4]
MVRMAAMDRRVEPGDDVWGELPLAARGEGEGRGAGHGTPNRPAHADAGPLPLGCASHPRPLAGALRNCLSGLPPPLWGRAGVGGARVSALHEVFDDVKYFSALAARKPPYPAAAPPPSPTSGEGFAKVPQAGEGGGGVSPPIRHPPNKKGRVAAALSGFHKDENLVLVAVLALVLALGLDLGGDVLTGFLVDALHGQLDLAAVVEAQDLDLDLLAHLQHVRGLGDPLAADFRDVDQAVAGAEELRCQCT